jgi:hypothetical protein
MLRGVGGSLDIVRGTLTLAHSLLYRWKQVWVPLEDVVHLVLRRRLEKLDQGEDRRDTATGSKMQLTAGRKVEAAPDACPTPLALSSLRFHTSR